MTTPRKRGTAVKPQPLTPANGSFHAVVEEITADVAQLVLDTRNVNNRPINRHHVEEMAEQIKAGDYAGLNGQTISFDIEGNLHDGQQRLAAIARSGLTVEALVVYNVEPDTRPTVDVGRKRTVADELSMRGEEDSKTVASILMMLKRIEFPGSGRNVVLTSVQAIKLLDDNPDVRLAAHGTRQLIREVDMPASVIGYCKVKFGRLNTEDDLIFWDVFSSGQYDGPDDPRFVLQRTLSRLARDNSFSTSSFASKVYQAALTIKAWNAWRQDRKISLLRFSSRTENFPEPM